MKTAVPPEAGNVGFHACFGRVDHSGFVKHWVGVSDWVVSTAVRAASQKQSEDNLIWYRG